MDQDKNVDESWKESASKEKEQIIGDKSEEKQGEEALEVNFLNYIASMGFQSMIFLGEVPHPISNQIEKNLDQAKFIIDTLAMIKEKTQGNLTEQEDNMLGATLYELQVKYVDIIEKESKGEEGKIET